jgi:hypothetical protein
MYAKNPLLKKLMRVADLRAQVAVDKFIDHKELEEMIISSRKQLKIEDMALQKKEEKNRIYLRPYDGAFRKWVEKPTPESKERTTSGGKVVNEELFSSVTGKLRKIYTYEKEMGDKKVLTFVIILKDDREDGDIALEMNFNSQFAFSFLCRLENIDLRKDVILKPYTILNKQKTKEKGKNVYNDILIPYQLDNGGKEVKIEAFWTKDNQGELPPIVEIKSKKVGGKSEWSTIDRDDFLIDYITKVNDKIKILHETNLREEKNIADSEIILDLENEMFDDLPY